MQKFLKILPFLVLLGAGTAIALKQHDKQDIPDQNQIINPGFESGKARWFATGSSVFTIDTATQAEGFASANWDASATGEFLRSALKDIPEGLKNRNCEVSFDYKTSATSGDLVFQMSDGTNDITIPETLAPVTDWTEVKVLFPCPGSGSLRAEVESTADAALIELDNFYMGKLREGSSLGSTLVAAAAYKGTASCVYPQTSTSLAAFSTVAACPAITVYESTRAVDTTDDDLPTIVFSDPLPPGIYVVTVNATVAGDGVTSINGELCLNDGTTTRGCSGFNTSGALAARFPMTLSAAFKYTTAQAAGHTFQLYGKTSSATMNLDMQVSDRDLTFKVEHHPLSAAQSVAFDKSNWFISAFIGGANPALPTGATNYTEVTDAGLDMVINPGSAGAEIPCITGNASTGLTCSGVDESIGVVFNPPWAGRYEVCADFTWKYTTGGTASRHYFSWHETNNTDLTVLARGQSRSAESVSSGSASIRGDWARRVCDEFEFTSTSKRTLRLFHETSGGSPTAPTINADRLATEGDRHIYVTVKPVVKDVQVRFTDLPVSTATDGVRMATAYIDGTGTPSVTRQDGSWIDSIIDNGVGDYTLNFVAGTFSAAPNCFGNAETTAASTAARVISLIDSTTLSAVRMRRQQDTGTDEDGSFSVMCVGPK